MAKTITATLVKTLQNPYATISNSRPPYLALLSFPQPAPISPPPAPPGGTQEVPTAAVTVAFELTAAELGALTPGCTVVFTSGTITPVVLPA